MIYKNFCIKNFKGIDDLEVDLSNNRIITLVGLNESGKTTILKAIQLFYTMIRGNEPSEASLNQLRPKGIDFSGEIIIKGDLVFEDEDIEKIKENWSSLGKQTELVIPKDFNYTFKFMFELHSFKSTQKLCFFDVKIKGDTKALVSSDNAAWQSLINYIKTDIIPEIIFYEDFIFDIPEMISFTIGQNLAPYRATGKNEIWQFVLDDVLKTVNSQFSFQESIVNIWATDNDTAINRISQIERALNEIITNSWKELFQKKSKKLNFKEIKLKNDIQGNILNFSFQVKTDSNKVFSINERSKGCKWFFSFLLFTEFRKNRTKNILFLLDEPASNLHSSAQEKIKEAIEELSDKSMVIYSTHSHHLISPKWLSGAYVVINEILSDSSLQGDINFDEGAKIQAVKYFRYIGSGAGSGKVSYFQPILDALDYKPSSVEPVPGIVILEGKNDWYTIKYFGEIILKIKDMPNLYPGAGKDQLWEIIRIYLSWGKTFVLMLDGDRGGEKAKKAYINSFEEMVNDRIYTLKDVGFIGELEDLICKDDQKTILDDIFGEGTFDEIVGNASQLKKKLNQSIVQLLIKKRYLDLSKETQEKFKKLLAFLKTKVD